MNVLHVRNSDEYCILLAIKKKKFFTGHLSKACQILLIYSVTIKPSLNFDLVNCDSWTLDYINRNSAHEARARSFFIADCRF